MVRSRVRNTYLHSDPALWGGISYDVKDKVADILIASVIMQE